MRGAAPVRVIAGCALLLVLVSALAHAAVKARLDNDRIAPGETVQLTLEHDGQTSSQPELSPLRQDFDVLLTSRSSSVQIVNGSISSHVRTLLTLAPKHTGLLVLPSITWDGERSPELSVTVGAAGGPGGHAAGADSAPPAARVFIETAVGQTDPFVQAAVNVTVRVFTQDQLYQPSLELPPSNDALVQQIGGDENRSVERNGVRYDVAERHYVIFPQHSGELKLPGAVLTARVPVRMRADPFGNDAFADAFGMGGGMVTGAKPIRVTSDPIGMHVRGRPAQTPASYWLPARGVTLSAEWRPDQSEAHVGDPLTLNLHLQADGLTAAQLPDLSALLALPAGLKSYPDQAKLNNIAQGDRIVGTRDQNIALIADQPGQFEVPAVHVSWWDTEADRVREASLPARTLTILPAIGSGPAAAASSGRVPAPATAPAQRDASAGTAVATRVAPLAERPRFWLWISVLLALLWAVTLLAWWLTRRRKGAVVPAAPAAEMPSPAAPAVAQPTRGATHGGGPRTSLDARGARAKFHEACGRSDAGAARRHLLAWAAAAWPQSPLLGLQALAAQLGNPDIGARLEELDRACFGGEAWNGAALAAILRELPARHPPAQDRRSKLAPLYP
jgi:hypothetical protein